MEVAATPAQHVALSSRSGSGDWELAFELSPIAMATVDVDGRWRRVNHALLGMLGYEDSDLLGMSLEDITHPDDLEADLELTRACLSGERDGYRIVKRYYSAAGAVVWGDLSVATARDESGHPVYFILQIIDVSDHRRTLDELATALVDLQKANEDLERFAAVAAHELRTPLTALRGMLELASGHLSSGSSPALQHVVARAEYSSSRLSALVDTLLAYALSGGASASGRGPLVRRDIDLSDIVDAAEVDLEDLPCSEGVTVSLSPRARSAVLCVSVDLTRILVLNILTNAVKYRDPDRDLQIDVDCQPGPTPEMLTIVIANDGPTMSPWARLGALEMYQRGDRPEISGSGIGLATCRRVAEWHGGTLHLEDPPRGRPGLRVCFTLPMA